MTRLARCVVIIQVVNTMVSLPVTAVPDFLSGQSVAAASTRANHGTAVVASVWWIKRIGISVAAAGCKDVLLLA